MLETITDVSLWTGIFFLNMPQVLHFKKKKTDLSKVLDKNTLQINVLFSNSRFESKI